MNKREVITILEDYSVLGKQSFNDILQHLVKTNEEIVDRHPAFMFPVTDRSMLIYLEGQDEFSGKSREELETKLQVFPVQMHNFVKAQQSIAKKFKDVLENRWAESLAQKVEAVVGKEFKLSPEVKEVFRAQLNPNVQKLFELIRLHQEKNLLDKLTATMEHYLHFLV